MANDNSSAISEKFRKLRIDRVNNWSPRLKPQEYDFLFPIEKSFLERIETKLTSLNKEVFNSLIYPYELDRDYHIYISYFIEALDVMPLKMDLSFDFSWKGLEFYMGKAYEMHKGATITNVSDLIKYSKNNYWFTIINTNNGLLQQVEDFFEVIPSQSYEYLAKRMLDNYSIVNPRSNKLYTRLAMTNGIVDVKIDNLLKDLFVKYGSLTDGDSTRKVGRIMYKLLLGETITLPDSIDGNSTNQYNLDIKEKIDILVNGLLYTYRNERFHGNTFSPFKSSKASLQTYSHAHYLFLWSYFLVNITKLYLNNINLTAQEVEINMSENIDSYCSLYGRHLNK
jgi:hypothetical protein